MLKQAALKVDVVIVDVATSDKPPQTTARSLHTLLC
jgi:hypothetical protein